MADPLSRTTVSGFALPVLGHQIQVDGVAYVYGPNVLHAAFGRWRAFTGLSFWLGAEGDVHRGG